MAITTDSVIHFFGTQDEVTTTPAEVTDGSFSIASDTSTWTNDDDAPLAMWRLVLTAAGLGGAPDGGTIDLYLQPQNIDGSTADQFIPSANFLHTYIGSFPIQQTDANQQILIGPIGLPNYKTSSEFIPFIHNQMGQTTGTGWELHVIPMTYGPHG
jgi:hypothetical protein